LPAADTVLEFLLRQHGAANALDVAMAATELFEGLGASYTVFRVGPEILTERGTRGAAALVEFAGHRVQGAVEAKSGEPWELFVTVVTQLVDSHYLRAQSEMDRRRHVHDLRGALAVVAGQCEMLESGVWGSQTESQQRSVGAMARQIERMRALLDVGR